MITIINNIDKMFEDFIEYYSFNSIKICTYTNENNLIKDLDLIKKYENLVIICKNFETNKEIFKDFNVEVRFLNSEIIKPKQENWSVRIFDENRKSLISYGFEENKEFYNDSKDVEQRDLILAKERLEKTINYLKYRFNL